MDDSTSEGWFPFGYHAQFATYETPVPELEFSEELDECGLPLWERTRQPIEKELQSG